MDDRCMASSPAITAPGQAAEAGAWGWDHPGELGACPIVAAGRGESGWSTDSRRMEPDQLPKQLKDICGRLFFASVSSAHPTWVN